MVACPPYVLRVPAAGLGLVAGLGLAVAALTTPAAAATTAPPASATAPQPTVLDDTPEPLRPKTPRTEKDVERLEAAALFATGRMLERKEEFAPALRNYQRMVRRDPQAEVVLFSIIPLARALGREAEANRYALLAAEWEDDLLGVLPEQPSGVDALRIRLELGRLYSLVHRHDRAAECFAAALAMLADPQKHGLGRRSRRAVNAASCRLMGETFLAARRPQDARAAFEKANALTANAGLLGFDRARVLLAEDKATEGLEQLDAYFKARLAVAAAAPYRLLGELLARVDREGEFTARLTDLRKADPANAALGYFLAERHQQAQAFDDALALLTELLATAPTGEGFAAAAAIHCKRRQYDRLFQSLLAAVTKAGSLAVLGDGLKPIAAEKEAVDAILAEAGRRAAGDKPDAAAALVAAELALEAQRFSAAEEWLERLARLQPQEAGGRWLELGLALHAAEKPKEAVRIFDRALARKPSREEESLLRFYRAGALAGDKQYEAALADARAVAAAAGDSPRLAAREGWVYYIARRNAEAEAALKRVVARFGDRYNSDDARTALREARLTLSHLAILAGRQAEGEEWLEQVLDEFPRDAAALNDLAYLWVERKVHLKRALAMIERAVAEEPDNAAFRDSLGWVYFRLGRYAEAVAELEKAAAEPEPDPVVLDHLGDAYSAAGRHQAARGAWQRSIAAFRKADEAEKAKHVETKLSGR